MWRTRAGSMSWCHALPAIREPLQAIEEATDDTADDETEDEKDKPAPMSATHMSK